MISRLPRVLVAAFVMMLPAFAGLHAQKSKGVVDLRYRLTAGTTLNYRVYSFDSIVIFDTVHRTLARERLEMVTLRCDSVLPRGYVMTETTTAYHDTERRDAVPGTEHNDHPWRGRHITFIMTATGRRVGLVHASGSPGSAPGGPFAPLLLPYFGPDTAEVGGSDNYANDSWLVDNIYPPIKWAGSCFRSVDRRFDTLGQTVYAVQVAEVATTNYRQAGQSDPVTHATTNGSGTYFFAKRLGYPVAGESQIINRFIMDLEKDRKVEGRHITGMMYELVRDKAKRPAGGTSKKTPPARRGK